MRLAVDAGELLGERESDDAEAGDAEAGTGAETLHD
jgi:hypothetical protein